MQVNVDINIDIAEYMPIQALMQFSLHSSPHP